MGFVKNFVKRLRKERELINIFREKGAMSYHLAIDPGEIENLNVGVLNRLIRKRVLERVEGNRFFLNERELMNHRMEKSKWGMIILLFILGVIILVIK